MFSASKVLRKYTLSKFILNFRVARIIKSGLALSQLSFKYGRQNYKPSHYQSAGVCTRDEPMTFKDPNIEIISLSLSNM
jgi:hypothetical protein